MTKRLDLAIVELNLAKSRHQAQAMIKNGNVTVDGIVCLKPSFNINDNQQLDINGESMRYVGRGGLKLEKALSVFDIDLNGKVCIDIGASTGGFTDCMLQNGSKKVYAVDVGHDQLNLKLINDSRVINLEKTNIRDIDKSYFKENIDFICIDVSFISLRLVLPKAKELLSRNGNLVALIKPQFEAGRGGVNKNGIIKSKIIHRRVLVECLDFSGHLFNIQALDFSPVTGGSGNIEYLLYMGTDGRSNPIEIQNTIDRAFESLKGGK